MKWQALALLTLGLFPGVGAAAQTADTLARARVLYDSLALERAVPMLRAILSPSWPYPCSAEQRSVALEYLGASFGLEDSRDSAVSYFRAALEADPFADLDPRRFTPAQITQFRRAQELVFEVAMRPVPALRLDPRTERASFTVLTTHAASLDVTLRTPAGDTVPLFHDTSAGLREVTWDLLSVDGRLAPAGRYELVARAQSRVLDRTDSARVYFDLARQGPRLRDTLPSLTASDLLAVRYGPREARADLVTGGLLAGGAFLVGELLPNRALGGEHRASVVMAGAALVTAMVTVLVRRHHPDLALNVAENVRRRAARAAANGGIRRDNGDKLNHTTVIITPAAGALP